MAKKTYKPFDDLLMKSGLRLEFIASEAGVPYSTLYKWRVNPSRINGLGLGNLSNVIGCDISELFDVVKNFSEKLDKKAS